MAASCEVRRLGKDTTDTAQLDMQDGDTLEVHQEQIGGC